jgi:hypothetical protein
MIWCDLEWSRIRMTVSGLKKAPPLLGGEDTLARRRGGRGVNILEDERHRDLLDFGV